MSGNNSEKSMKGKSKSRTIIFGEQVGAVRSVSISPDGRWALSSGGWGVLRMWELSTGRCVRTFSWLNPPDMLLVHGHRSTVNSVCFNPDGCWALSGDTVGMLKLWDLSKGECMRTFKGHNDWVTSVRISPDGRWALSGSKDKTLRLWELATGKCRRVFEGHTDSVTSVCIGPDGRWALSGSRDKTLRLWEFVWNNEFLELNTPKMPKKSWVSKLFRKGPK